MPLQPGQKLSHYRIDHKIGEGGMGVVWSAEDGRLGRQVAIKVLPELFAGDAERLARFEREARVLASLSHAGIAAIHGLEEADGVRFLVLELVGGETLAERLERGPVPPDEAVALGAQMAEALEFAHENGVVHRDLKPANVKITPEGNIKILDFGLAKGLGPQAGVTTEDSESPTLTKGTALGVIMGTASYMSPEQARGQEVDKRTDIWAFGCCLYEVLTGKKAFAGDTVTDIIAAVVNREPRWEALPEPTPWRVRELLEQC